MRHEPPHRYRQRSSADRVRRFRERQKRNAMLVTIEVPTLQADRMVETGFLEEWDAENPTEIRRAIEKVLAQLLA